MELGSDATLHEERVEVLASVRDAMRSGGRDPGLAAAAGFLLRHLAGTGLVPPEHHSLPVERQVAARIGRRLCSARSPAQGAPGQPAVGVLTS